MSLGYAFRASRSIAAHPAQGVERVLGRIDRYQDRRAMTESGKTAGNLYDAVDNWAARLHAAIGRPWPCPAVAAFEPVWERVVADLAQAGVQVGLASYGGWNDSDKTFAQAIWCVVMHQRPASVVETGVAHGITSRFILEGLERNRAGRLWSIDLPAVDSALHRQIGAAVPARLRTRWTYVKGTSRQQLPRLLTQLGEIGFFVHDSLHTGRNTRFELVSAWPVLRAGGATLVDDVDHSLAFRAFVVAERPRAWLVARHAAGPGLWGAAIKAA